MRHKTINYAWKKEGSTVKLIHITDIILALSFSGSLSAFSLYISSTTPPLFSDSKSGCLPLWQRLGHLWLRHPSVLPQPCSHGGQVPSQHCGKTSHTNSTLKNKQTVKLTATQQLSYIMKRFWLTSCDNHPCRFDKRRVRTLFSLDLLEHLPPHAAKCYLMFA